MKFILGSCKQLWPVGGGGHEMFVFDTLPQKRLKGIVYAVILTL